MKQGAGIRWLGWACAWALGGCADDGGMSDTEGTTEDPTGGTTAASADSDATGGPESTGSGSQTDGSSGPSTGTETEDTDGSNEVCDRWNADRLDLTEGTWDGDVGTCMPGDVSADGRERALRIVNLYRWLVDLPPVTTDPQRDAMAQACALMMHANGALSHNPPTSWTCYTADGAMGAGSSNISATAGVAAIDLYMVDPGNATTLGHRRWILSNSLGPTGLGSTDAFSCMWTLGGSGTATHEWTAWPNPGVFPVQAVQPSWTSIDLTGWSVQSDTIELGGAQVEITANGQTLPVTVTPLQPGYGSASAISMIPQGWTTQADTTYHVQITGISQPIEYDVEVVSCL